MLTIGVDLAAHNNNTGLCRIEWTKQEAVIRRPAFGPPGEENDWLAEAMQSAPDAWIGIDAPFGWPRQMVTAVTAHANGKPWPKVEKRELRYRLTDRVLQDEHRINPLSVSSDRIAVTAWHPPLTAGKTGRCHERKDDSEYQR